MKAKVQIRNAKEREQAEIVKAAKEAAKILAAQNQDDDPALHVPTPKPKTPRRRKTRFLSI